MKRPQLHWERRIVHVAVDSSGYVRGIMWKERWDWAGVAVVGATSTTAFENVWAEPKRETMRKITRMIKKSGYA